MERLNLILCGINSPMGKLAKLLTVGAQECWCCSFYRGCAVTLIPAMCAGYIIGRVL